MINPYKTLGDCQKKMISAAVVFQVVARGEKAVGCRPSRALMRHTAGDSVAIALHSKLKNI
jgi:hypothetical protein